MIWINQKWGWHSLWISATMSPLGESFGSHQPASPKSSVFLYFKFKLIIYSIKFSTKGFKYVTAWTLWASTVQYTFVKFEHIKEFLNAIIGRCRHMKRWKRGWSTRHGYNTTTHLTSGGLSLDLNIEINSFMQTNETWLETCRQTTNFIAYSQHYQRLCQWHFQLSTLFVLFNTTQ